jgi:hypothetical protein
VIQRTKDLVSPPTGLAFLRPLHDGRPSPLDRSDWKAKSSPITASSPASAYSRQQRELRAPDDTNTTGLSWLHKSGSDAYGESKQEQTSSRCIEPSGRVREGDEIDTVFPHQVRLWYPDLTGERRPICSGRL